MMGSSTVSPCASILIVAFTAGADELAVDSDWLVSVPPAVGLLLVGGVSVALVVFSCVGCRKFAFGWQLLLDLLYLEGGCLQACDLCKVVVQPVLHIWRDCLIGVQAFNYALGNGGGVGVEPCLYRLVEFFFGC